MGEGFAAPRPVRTGRRPRVRAVAAEPAETAESEVR